MKKILVTLALTCIFPLIVNSADDSFYEDILISDELKIQEQQKQAENAEKAKVRQIGQEAGKLLETAAPKIDVDLQKLEKLASQNQEQKRSNKSALSPAPFGLYWGAT